MIAVHLFGCIYGMRAAIPIMREQGYGRIVNVISRAAESPAGNNSAYGAAKAAMWVGQPECGGRDRRVGDPRQHAVPRA